VTSVARRRGSELGRGAGRLSGGHVVKRRLDAAAFGAAPPRGAARRQARWVHCGPHGQRSTVDTGIPPPDRRTGSPILVRFHELAAPSPWAGVRSRRAVSPNPRQGGTAPITAQLLACRAARPGPARPTAARRDRRAVPTGRVARPETAVPSLAPVGPRRPTGHPGPAGGAPPYRRAALPRRAARRPTGRAPGGVAPRLPCRLIPVRRHGAWPALAHWGRWPRDCRAALIPVGRHGTSTGPAHCGWWPRDCRAALSPWGGTAPQPAPPIAGGGPETAASLRSPAERRGTQPGCAVTVWRLGPETAVPPFPVGRYGTPTGPADAGGAARPPCRRVPAARRRPAVLPRNRAASTVALPVWAAAAEPPAGGAPRDRRAVCPLGGAAPDPPRSSQPGRRGVDSRVALVRGEEGDTAW